MKRIVGYAVGIAVLAALLCTPALFWNTGSGSAGTDETTISNYNADYTIDAKGNMVVREKLTVSFPITNKHGIFQFFDRTDQNAPHVRRPAHDFTVLRDGQAEPFDVLHEQHRRFVTLKIGSANMLVVAGEHVYDITYHIDHVLEPGQNVGADTQFYWNIIPQGWQQQITKSSLTVHLPANSSPDIQCAVGLGADAPSCGDVGARMSGAGTRTLKVKTRTLNDHTPVTIKTGVDLPTPDQGTYVPWSPRWDRVFSTSPSLLWLVLAAAAGAALLGALLGARSREKAPGFPILYAPPDGIGPAQAKYIYSETVDNESYVATMMYAAEKGAVALDRTGDAWTITDKAGPQGWSGLDEVTVGTAHLLGGPGSSFTANRASVSAGERLKTEIARFEGDVSSWAIKSGNMVSSGLGGFGGLLILAALAAAGAALIWNPFSMTMVGLIPGSFAICGTSLVKTGAGTSRTRAGRDLWSRVGGFRRILSTTSAEERFDFASRKELYTTYIPWAVALGCADEWAAKYRTEMGTEPPVPHYFAGYYTGAVASSFVNSMVDDFSGTVDSAISSYNATQSSSSSSGGGGFSGGGGGGGGGGGSW